MDDEEDGKMEEDDYQPQPEPILVSWFLKEIPGVVATDSQTYRIEALWAYLESLLGDEIFIAAYKHLLNISSKDVDEDDSIETIIGESGRKYIPLIHQLIVCEDNYYLKQFHQ